MNKKLLVVSILAVFMLVAITMASAVSSNTTTDEKGESPLFGIRTRRAIGERLGELKENIKANFIGDRMFFLPLKWLREKCEASSYPPTFLETTGCATCKWYCNTIQYETCGIFCK